MLTLPEALAAAQVGLPADVVLRPEAATETAYAWVIPWTTRRWLATRSWRDAPVGMGPLIVCRHSGRVTAYSSAYATGPALEKYEEEHQLYGLRVTADLADQPTRLLLKRLAQLSPLALLALARAPTAWLARGSRARLLALQQQWAAQGLATEVAACF